MEPTPPEDPAARFRKPGDAPPHSGAPAPAPEPPPASGFFQMLEDTLTAPLGLGTTFAKLAPAPAPDYPVMVANFAVYAAVFLALNMLRAHLSFPEAAARIDPAHLAMAGAVGLAVMTGLSFVWAGIFHALAKAAGGQASFQRSYQVFSLLSACLPALAAANAFHLAWIFAAAYWTYLAAVAVENLEAAPAGRARSVFGAAVAAAVAIVWFASVQVERQLAPYIAAARLQAQLGRQAADAENAAAFHTTLSSAAAQDPALMGQQLMLQAQQMMQSSGAGRAPGASSGSGLDLVAKPSGSLEQLQANTQQIQKQAAQDTEAASKSLDTFMPMLDNPELTKNMPPEQLKNVKALTALLHQMQVNLKSGKPMDPAQAAELTRLQQAAMQSMMQDMQKDREKRQAAANANGSQP